MKLDPDDRTPMTASATNPWQRWWRRASWRRRNAC